MGSRVYVITDPQAVKLLADPTRRAILRLLSKKEMSATDLAKKLGKNHSSVVHHLNSLLSVGLIKVTREKKTRNMVQPYYRAISEEFHVSYRVTEDLEEDPDYSLWTEAFLEKLVAELENYGVKIPEEEKPKVKSLLRKMHLYNKKAFEERLQRKQGDGKVGKHAKRTVAHILSHVQLLGNPSYVEMVKELREVLDKYSDAKWEV